MTPVQQPSSSALQPVEVILAHAHQYELGPLVWALEHAGVPLSRIYFDGRPMPQTEGLRGPVRLAPQGGLVVGARLREGTDPLSVVIHLTTGLFGARSPLPSYFQALLQDEVLVESLGDLLHVLDDSLWRARVSNGHARRGLYPVNRVDTDLAASSVGSDPLYVDWLFRQVFPELRVAVERCEVPRGVKLDTVHLGYVTLGQCALQGRTTVAMNALLVTLTTAFDSKDGAGGYKADRGESWMEEVQLRMRRDVLPRFLRHPLNLRVVLRVLASRTQSKVTETRVGQALVVTAKPPFEFTLFSGALGVS